MSYAKCTPWGTIRTGPQFQKLTPGEKAAVIAHETAHIRNHDSLKRIWWLVTLRYFFRPEWVAQKCKDQEFAADQYVKDCGLAPWLAMFLARAKDDSGGPFHPSVMERVRALNG
jgi:Zn-dependent protease with chaperone function